MLVDRERLEHRKVFLTAAIAYVEDMRGERGRDTEEFLAWCRHELSFVEILLQEQRLLDQVISLRLASSKIIAPA